MLKRTHLLHRRIASLVLAVTASSSASIAYAQNAWIVGQSAPLTGDNAAMGVDIRDGAKAIFASVNAAGGVNGKNIELVTLDDGNDRKKAGANAAQLLETSAAAALFGFASATLSLDAIPQAEKAGVLFFAPFSGANALRRNNPVVYTLRSSYAQELEKMLAFWTSIGMKQVAVVHYDDEIGNQNLKTVEEFLKKIDKKPMIISLKRSEPVKAEQLEGLIHNKPDVIVNTALSSHAAQISKFLISRHVATPMSSLSFVGAQQYIDAAGKASAGVSIAQVVPNASSPIAVARECGKALKDAGVTRPMNGTHLEACIAAKVLVEAMRKTKKIGDRAGLLASLESLGSFDVGGFVVNYGKGGKQGSNFVDLAMVDRDGKLRN
jgi:ABC-type branched-subunit amino acid transport system substrate-binding protein